MRNFEAHNGPKRIRKQAGGIDFGEVPGWIGPDDPDPDWDWGAEMAQSQPEPEPEPEELGPISEALAHVRSFLTQLPPGRLLQMRLQGEMTSIMDGLHDSGVNDSMLQGFWNQLVQMANAAMHGDTENAMARLEFIEKKLGEEGGGQRQSYKLSDGTHDEWMGTPSADNTGTEDWSIDQLMDAPYPEGYSDAIGQPPVGPIPEALAHMRQLLARGPSPQLRQAFSHDITTIMGALHDMGARETELRVFWQQLHAVARDAMRGKTSDASERLGRLESRMSGLGGSGQRGSHKLADATYDQWMGTPSADNTGTEDWSVDQILDAPYAEGYSEAVGQPQPATGTVADALAHLRNLITNTEVMEGLQFPPVRQFLQRGIETDATSIIEALRARGISGQNLRAIWGDLVDLADSALQGEAGVALDILEYIESVVSFEGLDDEEGGLQSQSRRHSDATHDRFMDSPNADNTGTEDWSLDDILDAPYPEGYSEKMEPSHSSNPEAYHWLEECRQAIEEGAANNLVSISGFFPLMEAFAKSVDLPFRQKYWTGIVAAFDAARDGETEEAIAQLDALRRHLDQDGGGKRKQSYKHSDSTYDEWMGTPNQDNQGLYDWDQERDLWGAQYPEGQHPQQQQSPVHAAAEELRSFVSELKPEQVGSLRFNMQVASLCSKLEKAINQAGGDGDNLSYDIYLAWRSGELMEMLDILDQVEQSL